MAHVAWKWLVVAAGVGVGVLACGDDDDDGNGNPTGEGTNVVRPGMGEDEGEPRGKPLNLPAGIVISGDLYGANDITDDCGKQEPGNGSGEYVRVCVPLRNTTGGPIQVEFPPGLTLITRSEGYQNGLLVERVVVEVPPTPGGPGGLPDGGPDPDAYVVPLFTYCLNEERTPSDTGTPYKLGNVTDDAAITELLGLVKGKNIDTDDEVDAVQHAIYSITERTGLTSRDRADLADIK
ncbi:hypothetical protein [Myxococcus sp. RHSTA-1-4]|uniref:hypothetical protein n=1 Tax=Myxococcus sp. RHSTA-1-4 TaxID=2874601 RepID=UPI001CBB4A6C|nr:hypothetical protein [Myxococcus sp. RHSTA-1-4]MBZ4417740.1 hypothetical protein [Myxococcus sp. RHSTA-1-4]